MLSPEDRSIRQHNSGHHNHNSHHLYITRNITSNSILNKNSNTIKDNPNAANKLKYTTKHLAALGFLSNIPMKNELKIREMGLNNITRTKAYENNEELSDESNDDEEDNHNKQRLDNDYLIIDSNILVDEFQNDSVGIKLKGFAANTIRYPLQFRYNFNQLSDQSAIVRQWEDTLLKPPRAIIPSTNTTTVSHNTSILASRVFSSRQRNYPTLVFSIIKYDAGEEQAKIKKIKAEDQKGFEVFDLPRRDWRGYSYKKLFKVTHITNATIQSEDNKGNTATNENMYYHEKGFLYDPNIIDDPDMLHGAHRYVLQRHHNTGFEIATIAIGMINFERLCMKSLVTKFNRRLSMAVSMVLAIKFNETLTTAYQDRMNELYSYFDREWNLPKKQIFDAEFGAYVHLNFSMHLPFQHINLMYTRLLKLLNKSSKQYLGEDMSKLYISDILSFERQKESILNSASHPNKTTYYKFHNS